MICTRFICILTSDRRKGYPFLYNHSDSFPSQCAWHQSGCIRWKAAKCKNCKGNQKRILDNIANRIIRKMVDIYDLLFMAVSYTTKSVSCTRCQPHMCCIWISFNLVLIKKNNIEGALGECTCVIAVDSYILIKIFLTRWNHYSIPKLPRLHRRTLEMDKIFHPTPFMWIY